MGALPVFIKPQLARLRTKPPRGAQWVHEIKYDGYRMAARIEAGDVRLISRNHKDWTSHFPAVVAALRALKVENAYVDGELCAVTDNGKVSFPAIRAVKSTHVYFAFDLLFLNGERLTREPLHKRKARLEKLLAGASVTLQFCEHIEGEGQTVLKTACEIGAEGIISKQLDRAYVSV